MVVIMPDKKFKQSTFGEVDISTRFYMGRSEAQWVKVSEHSAINSKAGHQKIPDDTVISLWVEDPMNS